MFKNYFTTSFRNFWRNKTFSFINVLGLSVGITAALVIFLIVYYEFSYDKFEPDADRVYRVVLDANFGGTEGHSASVPAPLGSAIENEVTGVQQTIPVFQFPGDANSKVSIASNNPDKPTVYKKQPSIVFTNAQYFDLLTYKWLAGNAKAAMQNPFSVVLTETRAKQYFPSLTTAAIIGKEITYNDDIKANVTGIVQDLHKITGFTGEEFISLATIAKTNLQERFMMTVWNDWMSYSQLYVKLSEGKSPLQIEAQLKGLLTKYDKNPNKNITLNLKLQPLSDVHFNGNYQGGGQTLGHKDTLYGLLAIAAFLLLLGRINFINLTTAQSTQRAKEIGIRKTIGSSKKQLVFQFLGEAFFITVMAAILSILLTPFLMNLLGDFIPKGLTASMLYNPYVIFFIVLLIVSISILSGLYPAFVLSALQPVSVLKNQAFISAGQTRNAWVRKTLTVSQFVIAQFFIIGTVMVSKQINYSLNADLGFKKDAVVTFNVPHDTVKGHVQQLLNEIKAMPEVELASQGFMSPADEGMSFTNILYPPKKELQTNVQIRWGDADYLQVYQIKLLAGRNVTPSDTIKEFVINDNYAKLLGFQKPEDALGKALVFGDKNMPIVGVMQDFHAQSFRAPIGPVVFGGSGGTTLHVRLQPNDKAGKTWQNALAKMQYAFARIYPEADFDYRFFDEKIAKIYEREQQTASLLKWATGLSILISCLGLFGLVIYTTNTRTKEVGIRKILGASVANIISILSKDFVKLVLLAFVIAAPIAWWASYKWLEDYAYRTNISWWVFALSGIAMLLIALLTLSIQTIKTAVANPVKNLRTE